MAPKVKPAKLGLEYLIALLARVGMNPFHRYAVAKVALPAAEGQAFDRGMRRLRNARRGSQVL